MRKIKFSNDYIEFLNVVNNEVIESNAFPLSDIYFKFDKRNISFYLKSNDQPFKKSVWFDTLPLIIDDETYDDYESASEALSVAFGEPSKELKEKVEEIEGNLNTALTNIEDNTERIEDLSEEVVSLNEEMEQKADLSEVYTQEQTDLRLNLKVDTSTLQNQYYDKNATDAKLALKSDKENTYNKTEVDNLLSQKASTDDIDLLETQIDSINDNLVLKANKADVYTKAQTDNLLAEKADIDSIYNKSEVDIKLDEKANKADTYNKTEVDGLLAEKVDKTQLTEDYYTKAETYTKTQVDNIVAPLARQDDLVALEATLINNYYDKGLIDNMYNQMDSSVNAKADKEYTYTKLETNDLLNQKANVEDLSLKADIDSVYGREYIDSHLNEKANAYELDGKQDTLVNQQNIKSVQNHDILGEGNIELFSMMNQDEYDSLEEKDSNKLYLITDTHRVYYQDNLIIDGSATPTPEPETTMVTFYYTDGAEGDYIEYAQLKGVAPYTITRQAVMDCLDEAIAKEGIARMVTKIELSDGVHRIDNEAFSGFTSLKEVQYGANLREMGSSAFTHCTSLRNLVIPDSVTGETDFTFTECENATTCYVGTGITTLGGDTFCDCPNLTSCHIPSNVTNLGGEHGGVFARCYALTSVTIDGQIDHIGSNTFLLTDSLTELWLTGCTNVPSVESDTFVLSDPSNVTVHIPCNMTDAYQMTPFWDIFMDHYVEEGCGDEPTEGKLVMTLYKNAPDAEDSVAYEVYQNDGETIKEALDRYLGDTFGYGGDYDDQHCREFKLSITHVAFSNNITQIESTNVGLFGYGTDAGYGEYDGGWQNIVSVTLPSNLQTIGNNVFQIMPKVSQWNIPSTVTSIGNSAFERRTQDPNVNRTIRFNSNSCPSLGNSSFDILDEEEMMVGADTNQTFKVNCGYLSEYSSAFNNMGGSYETYSANELITEDCTEPEPTGETETHVIFYDENGDIIASLEGLSPYNITQSAVEGLGESIKENCRKVLFGYNVNSIGEKAFVGFDKVSEWTIQKRDTTEIGNFAFARTDNSTVRTFIFTNAATPLNTETLGNNVFDRTNEGIMSLAADENTYFKVNGCDALFNLIDTLQNKDGYYSQYIERVSNLNDEECH